MTEHEQRNFNDALHKNAVAQARLRIIERTMRSLSHGLEMKLCRAKAKDQLPMLYALEEELKRVLPQ